ncbi:hypothetical protein IKG12_00480 [Candidatus Saccharibacteria bacterium]|nr:hypothetical protein [Candidatus Saccharibacteria bacterium]
MSKIFKISGNFVQNGKWAQPDPSFAGEIAVDDDNTFHGYCNELYNGDAPDIDKTRYLAGKIATNSKTGKECIAFLKLSNFIEQAPLAYSASGEEGVWGAFAPWSTNCILDEEARVKIEEVAYSLKDEQRIKNEFNGLNMSINLHDYLLLPEKMQSFMDALINAW